MYEIIIWRKDEKHPITIYVNEDQLEYELQLLEHDPDVADYGVNSL